MATVRSSPSYRHLPLLHSLRLGGMPHSSSMDLEGVPTDCFLPIALPQAAHLLSP